jgi:transposase-like protein
MNRQPADRHHNREPGWPEWGRQNLTLTAALRMVRMYGDRIPSVAQLRADFGVSRATAFRWRAAFRDAIEQHEAANAG